jgi:hypothetical protein
VSKKSIPDEVKQQANEVIAAFNEGVIKDPSRHCTARYKGSYLYIDRYDHDVLFHVCRLEYTGKTDVWEFAVFKYSDECYDQDEWCFPGFGHVDGTIAGALRAGLRAYPV